MLNGFNKSATKKQFYDDTFCSKSHI